MKKSTLGKNKLQVTPIGLGLAALGRPGYINLGHAMDLGQEYDIQAMESHTHQVLDAAWQGGVRYFDAARSYGRAERFLGSWLRLRQINPSELSIGSKWGYTYTANWKVEAEVHEVKDHSLPVLKRQISESRNLLGDYLKLYQIHSATLESGVLDNQPVLAELANLRNQGLVIGLSLSGTKQAETLERAREVEFDGKPLFGSVQATWNLLEPSIGDLLNQVHDDGMGVIIKEALANGRLTSRNLDPDFDHSRQILQEVAGQLDTTVDAVALAAVLAQSWVDVVLSGAATVEQLQSNLRAVTVEFNPEQVERLHSIAETPEHYWQVRSQLPWN